ncbi:alkylhydroperoxidase AhpD family core domain-containing protein [Arboricoccus pini]|uniref:Alkylhydroperoxidase AhpD family core domain-containing protein n=1 Tax=Arboricoccus pini TaxID=1963835 RepID=A0A212PZV1_9PROT|nr:carboxymuconolactone decarboxylase family protein [Arboricoccus pini]SNB52621.1 alkylhydroperoxidase AhpD family core domain-containing protein [Arboricoccus pini]
MTKLIEYDEASDEVKAIYEEIMAMRGFRMVPAFYRALAIDPISLRSFWNRYREVLSRPKLTNLQKELVGIAVSVCLSSNYSTEAHVDIARKLGMDDEALGELIATIGIFSEVATICKTLSLNYDGDPQ